MAELQQHLFKLEQVGEALSEGFEGQQRLGLPGEACPRNQSAGIPSRSRRMACPNRTGSRVPRLEREPRGHRRPVRRTVPDRAGAEARNRTTLGGTVARLAQLEAENMRNMTARVGRDRQQPFLFFCSSLSTLAICIIFLIRGPSLVVIREGSFVSYGTNK
jgi:hypothetical protein